MPNAFNNLFRPGSRRASNASTSEGSHLDTESADSQSASQRLPLPKKSSSPSSSRVSPKPQRSVPPIETRREELRSLQESNTKAQTRSRRSDTCPAIDLISPQGSNQRHLFGPGALTDDDSLGPLSAVSSYASPSSGSSEPTPPPFEQGRRDDRTPLAPTFRGEILDLSPNSSALDLAAPMASRAAPASDDEDDPLYSLAKPVPRKATREPAKMSAKKSARTEVPDRHDIMRRAMAEAAATDAYGNGGTIDMTTVNKKLESAPGAQPAGRRTESPEKERTKSGHMPQSSSQHTFIDHETPGEGSLSIKHFAKAKDGGAPDSQAQAQAPATEKEKQNRSLFGSGRTKTLSRSNSFASIGSAKDAPDNGVVARDHARNTVDLSPDKTRQPGRSVSTATPAAPLSSKQTSLAVPGTNGSLEASHDSRHRMHESASTGSLLGSRFRRPSDSGSTKGAKPSSGIAGALASTGMAGMGVGNADLYKQSQQTLTDRQSPNKSPSRPRTPSHVYKEFVGASQGGVYRDPSTGKMVEHGPDAANGDDMVRGRSATAHSLNSTDGSDISAASGLHAAADFARGLQQNNPRIDTSGIISSATLSNGSAPGAGKGPLLTPNGIGAVGGLSPSGLGERVELDGDEHPWPGDVDPQITGFAVASSKRNADFHALFTSVPEDDYLIEDYGCALVREILLQGRLYVSENHICFYANIFGWITNIVLPFADIVSIEKRMTAYVIPNAIQVATLHSKHTFASFLSRDTTFDVMVNIWKLSHPTLPTADSKVEIASEDEEGDEEEDKDGARSKRESTTDGALAKKSKRKKFKSKLGKKDEKDGAHGIAAAIAAPDLAAAIARGKSPIPPGAKKQAHRKTTCACEKDKKHFATVALDTTYPTAPEKLYNLVFTSGFMKGFWTDNQKLMELQMSDWAPNPANNNMLSREISYIKPLSGGFGPKQTKCLLTDENEHVDFDEYVTTMTTTRTPEVPSGGSFSVKTRTCITWDGGNVSRMYVTCMVEWTGRSMVKGIIDRASIDGQKQYYTDLDAAIRCYIKEHASEFREEGEDPAETAAAVDEPSPPSTHAEKGATVSEAKEEQQGLAKYVAMAVSAGSAVVDFGAGTLDMLSDLLGGVSPKVIVMGFIVLMLIISNLLALRGGSGRDPLDPHRLRPPPSASSQRPGDATQSAEAVALAVRDVLKDYFEPHGSSGGPLTRAKVGAPAADPAAEIARLLSVLDDVETRVKSLRESLKSMDVPEAA